MTHSDARSRPTQAASEAQPDAQSQSAGGSGRLDAQAALGEQDPGGSIEGEPGWWVCDRHRTSRRQYCHN